MPPSRGMLALSLVPALAGCSASSLPEVRPGDFQVSCEWSEGSLPPPFHYEYTIAITPLGEGTVTMVPDYAFNKPPTWTETFTLTAAEMDALYRVLNEQGSLTTYWRTDSNPPIGGSHESIHITAGNRQVEIPEFVVAGQTAAATKVQEAVHAAVPQALWDKLEAQRQQYVEDHRKQEAPAS